MNKDDRPRIVRYLVGVLLMTSRTWDGVGYCLPLGTNTVIVRLPRTLANQKLDMAMRVAPAEKPTGLRGLF
jgi:hypothetical protein